MTFTMYIIRIESLGKLSSIISYVKRTWIYIIWLYYYIILLYHQYILNFDTENKKKFIVEEKYNIEFHEPAFVKYIR